MEGESGVGWKNVTDMPKLDTSDLAAECRRMRVDTVTVRTHGSSLEVRCHESIPGTMHNKEPVAEEQTRVTV